ncbi:hypothetical protein THAOC_05997, partial [Thalassiosira oceanica]
LPPDRLRCADAEADRPPHGNAAPRNPESRGSQSAWLGPVRAEECDTSPHRGGRAGPAGQLVVAKGFQPDVAVTGTGPGCPSSGRPSPPTSRASGGPRGAAGNRVRASRLGGSVADYGGRRSEGGVIGVTRGTSSRGGSVARVPRPHPPARRKSRNSSVGTVPSSRLAPGHRPPRRGARPSGRTASVPTPRRNPGAVACGRGRAELVARRRGDGTLPSRTRPVHRPSPEAKTSGQDHEEEETKRREEQAARPIRRLNGLFYGLGGTTLSSPPSKVFVAKTPSDSLSAYSTAFQADGRPCGGEDVPSCNLASNQTGVTCS